MKERLDIILVERRLVESRVKAQWLIRNKFVKVEDEIITKPGKKIDLTRNVELLKEFPYVGKGGLKLEEAINQFSISIKNKICADIGASIGGFTDCLIKKGALRVYSIDTATNLLHPSLLCEKMKGRVVPLLGIDARKLDKLQEKIDLCTVDVTFTSLKDILPRMKELMRKDGDIITLVKPLFEGDFHTENKFKIIIEPDTLHQILADLQVWGEENGFFSQDLIKSPLKGKGGSIEFFFHFRLDGKKTNFDLKEKFDIIMKTLGKN